MKGTDDKAGAAFKSGNVDKLLDLAHGGPASSPTGLFSRAVDLLFGRSQLSKGVKLKAVDDEIRTENIEASRLPVKDLLAAPGGRELARGSVAFAQPELFQSQIPASFQPGTTPTD